MSLPEYNDGRKNAPAATDHPAGNGAAVFEFLLEKEDGTVQLLSGGEEGGDCLLDLRYLAASEGKLRVRRVVPVPATQWQSSSSNDVIGNGNNNNALGTSTLPPAEAQSQPPSDASSGPLPNSLLQREEGGLPPASFPPPLRGTSIRSQSESASNSRLPSANLSRLSSNFSEEFGLPSPAPPLPPAPGGMMLPSASADYSFSSSYDPTIPVAASTPPPPPPVPPPPGAAQDRANTTGASMPRRLSRTLRTSPANGRNNNPNKLSHQRDKRMSMRVLAQLSTFSDYAGGQNTLHRICRGDVSTIHLRRIQDIMDRFPKMVQQTDEKGQLPLHVLGNNSDLVNFYEGQKIATKVALLLMDAYPQSIITPDAEGRMPFTYLILKWVEWTFDQDEAAAAHNNGGALPTVPPTVNAGAEGECRVCDIITKINEKVQIARKSSSLAASAATTSGNTYRRDSKEQASVTSSGRASVNLADSLRDSLMSKSSNRFPPVMIFDEVEWCFEMLSYGMDHLGGKPLDPSKKVRPRLAYSKQRQDRQSLAENIAEIPLLLKTVLLLESKQTRSNIMDCSAIRRTLLCDETIGPWLTNMIRYKKGTSSEVAVEFLETVSRLEVTDYVGEYRKALPHDEKLFREAKLEVFKAVEKLGDLIRSLLLGGEVMTDRAVATPLVWFVMNRRIAEPFTVGVGVTDFKLHLTAILAFRQMVLDHTDGEEFFVVFPWMTLSSVIFWVAAHHLVRKACEFAALGNISGRTFKKVLMDMWSLVDLLGITLALWVSIWSKEKKDFGNGQTELPFLMAVILGLLWLRLLGFLKVVNEQLATFILALTRMLLDLRFFIIVLCLFILMFGDMFQLVVRNDDEIDCSSDELDPAIEEFCSRRSLDSYLRTYAIVVGDFEFEQYNGLGAATFLWFSVTFLGTIVLLNVLIAIVTMSYSTSQEVSVILYRRARAQFLATHEAMERFCRPSESNWASRMSVWSLTYVWLMFLRWIMVLTFVTTTLWSSLYLIEVAAYCIREQLYILAAPCILVAGAMAYSLWFSLLFAFSVLVEQLLPRNGQFREFFLDHIDKENERAVKKISEKLFGIDRNNTEGGHVTVQQNAEVLARLDQLEGMLEQILAKNAREEEEEMEQNFEEASATIQEDDEFNMDY